MKMVLRNYSCWWRMPIGKRFVLGEFWVIVFFSICLHSSCVCVQLSYIYIVFVSFLYIKRIEYNPSEAKVWVISSGTENTVFSWSVWRRLPLHEVCNVTIIIYTACISLYLFQKSTHAYNYRAQIIIVSISNGNHK